MAKPKAAAPSDVPHEALAALARLRKEAEAEIERLLGFLDQLGPDPDLEPQLGAPERHPGKWDRKRSRAASQALWAAGTTDDNEEQTGDDEPSFGHPIDEEREDDPAELGIGDSGGLDTDEEYSLGSSDGVLNQVDAWRYASDELERAGDEEPSLGSLDDCDSQAGWGNGDQLDREIDEGPA